MIDSTTNTAFNTAADSVESAAAVVSEPSEAVSVPVYTGKFAEQIKLMSASDGAKIEAQLTMDAARLNDSMVYKIVETHGGGYSILYKNYSQAVVARDVRDSLENLNGHRVLPIAKARLGDTYCKGTYSAEVGCQGESDTFTLQKLVEFQATGLIVVMAVIVGLSLLCYATSFIMQKLGLTKEAKTASTPASAPKTSVPATPAVQTLPPAVCTLDPNAPSEHPGFTNKQLQAFLSMAAVAALDVHPGISNEKLAVIFAIAAAEVLGEPCQVVKFRKQNATNWAWVAAGRADLHSNWAAKPGIQL